MNSLTPASRVEKLIAAQADLIPFDLAYGMVAAVIPRDEPEAPAAVPALPLAEWLRNEASWYEAQDNLPGADLIAAAILRIADAADLHGLRSVGEILMGSPLFARCNLAAPIETPDRRPNSLLAEIVDAEVNGYLVLNTDAGRLVAWTLLELSEEVDFFHADTVPQFLERRAAWEADRERDADAWSREHDDPLGDMPHPLW